MDNILKRKNGPVNDSPMKRTTKHCGYGEDCYRKNPVHFKEYGHPHLESILDNYDGTGNYPIPPNLMMQQDVLKEQLDLLRDNNIYQKDPGAADNNHANKTPKYSIKATSVGENDRLDGQSSSRPSNTKDSTVRREDINSLRLKNIERRQAEAKAKIDGASSSNKSPRPSSSTEGNANASREPINDLRLKNIERLKLEPNARTDRVSSSTQSPSSSTLKPNQKSPTASPKKLPDIPRGIEDVFSVVNPRGKMAEKLEKAFPFNIFYTTIAAAPETHRQPLSVTFQELLDSSLGVLEKSLQINFMVDIGWLLAQYYFAGYSKKPLTILYGDETPDIKDVGKKSKNVETHHVSMANPFGTHHTKMSILCYEDGSLRVVVSTANLYIDDWENRTQALWISPRCPELPEGAMPHEGDSETGFKKTLVSYLSWYRMSALTEYIERVKRTDFSAINVFLVASVPGSHNEPLWGMTRVASLLSKHCALPKDEAARWEVIAQASSIGSFGKEPKLWLTGDFLRSFSRSASLSPLGAGIPRLRFVYPSLDNVRGSHDNLLGGGCLPYGAAVHEKQNWLVDYMCQWKAKSTGRDRAMPHVKSYTRVSPDHSRAAFYLVTSSNLSKAAWGNVNKGNAALRIANYEAGVLLLPRFVVQQDHFNLSPGSCHQLTLPYDLPLTPYQSGMVPWVMDYLR